MRPPACVRRRTDGADAAVRRRSTLQMLNYMSTITLPRQRPAMDKGEARILHWWLQKLSTEAFFLKKVDDLFSRRPQNLLH